MSNRYIVQRGDCLFSLAARAGIPYQRIAQHPDNQELMRKRPNPSMLLPGDELTIPALEIKTVLRPTEKRHRFVVKKPKVEIRVKICELGEPRRHETYHVEVGGKIYPGRTRTTGADGMVVCEIPADADTATVVVGAAQDRYELALGHVDPQDTVEGLMCRLANLGHYNDGIDGSYDAGCIEAMQEFLAVREGIERDASSPNDIENRTRLVESYGS